MTSAFDNIFSNVANTFHNVFGEPAVYVVEATGLDVELKFNLISLEKTDRQEGGSRFDSWMLTGCVLMSDVAKPAKGDTIILDSDDEARVFKLTEVPTLATDGVQWEVVFRHDVITRRGGNNVFPI